LPNECGLFSVIPLARKTAEDLVKNSETIKEITAKVKEDVDIKTKLITTIIAAIASIIAAVASFSGRSTNENKNDKPDVGSYQQVDSGYYDSIKDIEERLGELERNTNNNIPSPGETEGQAGQ
jgi:hypothetical protein